MADNTVQIRLNVDARQGVAAIGDQSRAFASLRQQVEVTQLSFGRLAVAVAAGNAVFAAAGQAIKSAYLNLPRALLDGALSAEKMQSAFKALEGSLEGARGQIAFVRAEAQRLGVPLEEAGDAWLKLAAAARGTALEGEASRKIFTAVAGASSALGLSAQETSGALLAISQMMSKGTVQAEELRGQLGERIPGAFQIAARAMGVSTSALSDMLDQGRLLADDFLPKFAAQLAQELPASADTTRSAIVRLNNAANEWRQTTGAALAVAIDGMFGLKNAAGQLGRDDQVTAWARRSALAIAAFIDVVRELVLFVPNVLRTIGGSIATVARDIKLAADIAAAVVTHGVGAAGRTAMKKALEERNAFVAEYNKDMTDRWLPKQLTTRVEEFFAGLAKTQADGAARAGRFLEAELTREQQKTVDALKTKQEKLAAEYEAHAANLYAALTSGAMTIDQYNAQRRKLEEWYREQQNKGVNNRDKKQGALRLIDRADLDADLAVLKDALARAKAAYDAALEDRLVSIRDYYARKTALEQQEIDAEIGRQQALRAEQRRIQSDPRASEADRIRAKGEVAKIEAELIVLNNRRADAEIANARAAARAERELADALEEARLKLAQLAGTETEADRRAAIERSYRDLKARLAAEGQDTAIVDRLIDVEAASRNLEALEGRWRLALERMRLAQDAANIQAGQGLITTTQAQERIAGANRAAAEALDALLPKMEAAANAIGSDEQIARIQAWRNELAQVKTVVDPVAQAIDTDVRNAFTGFFESIGSGAKSAGEAFRDFARSVVASIQRIAAQKLAERIFGAGGFDIGKIFSGLFKGFAAGGHVTGGTPGRDSVPALLMPGEYVLRREAVQRLGVALLDGINGLKLPPTIVSGRLAFAAGGIVPATAPPQPGMPHIRIVNAVDPDIARDYLDSPAGEQTLLNMINRNAVTIRNILGG